MTTEQEINELFKKFGAVQSCNLVIDKTTGKSKGFAFVEMPKPGDAKAAVKTLNGNTLAGNIIRVKKATAKKVEIDKDQIDEKVSATDSTTSSESITAAETNNSVKTKQNNENPKTKDPHQTAKNNKSGSTNRNIWSSK
jgi:RNA recognition motif-containing protein